MFRLVKPLDRRRQSALVRASTWASAVAQIDKYSQITFQNYGAQERVDKVGALISARAPVPEEVTSSRTSSEIRRPRRRRARRRARPARVDSLLAPDSRTGVNSSQVTRAHGSISDDDSCIRGRGTCTPKFSFFQKFGVDSDHSSPAAFFNYATVAMCREPLLPIAFPRAGDPGRGHARPPPAIVCGTSDEILRTKISNISSKVETSKFACSMPAISPTGTPCPPVPAERGHVYHSAAIADHQEGTLSQPSRPTDIACSHTGHVPHGGSPLPCSGRTRTCVPVYRYRQRRGYATTAIKAN